MALKLKINWYVEAQDYLFITFGLIAYVTGLTCFIMPHEITCGGTTGLGLVVFYATGWWKVQYTFFLCNAFLLAIAFKILSPRYCVKTLFSVGMLTLLISGAEWLLNELYQWQPDLFPSGYNQHVSLPIVLDNAFMSCIVGGALQGLGLGWVFLRNGSTGGTDVIASCINKYKDMSLGTLVMLCDIVIISSSITLPDSNLQKLLYGFTALLVMTLMIDYVVNSARQSVQFLIFSERYDEIASAINELHRGVTVLDGRGWYTQKERKVLVVLARKRESPIILRIIQTIDNHAFVSQSLARGVFGFGFDAIKVQREDERKRKKIAAQAKADQEASASIHTKP